MLFDSAGSPPGDHSAEQPGHVTTAGGEQRSCVSSCEQLKQCHSDVGIKVPPHPRDSSTPDSLHREVQHSLSTTLLLAGHQNT